MSENRISVEVQNSGPGYLGWRGELLAELALAHIPGLAVYKRPDDSPSDIPYDFLVAARYGLCFFVEVKAFSSYHQNIGDVREVSELRWPIDADLIRRARDSRNPVLLFLFDADTDHGRYLRLDTMPAPRPDDRRITARFPVAQTINRASLESVLSSFQGPPTAHIQKQPEGTVQAREN